MVSYTCSKTLSSRWIKAPKATSTPLENFGATKEDARTCNLTGCYEYSVQGGLGTGMNYFNLLKPLELAMHGGNDALSGEFIGRKSPDVSEYKTFDEFYEEYKNHAKHIIEIVFSNVNVYEDYLSYINPQSMLSATFDSCLEKAKDSHCGGGTINSSSLDVGFLADAADSLTAIKNMYLTKKSLPYRNSRKSLIKTMRDTNYSDKSCYQIPTNTATTRSFPIILPQILLNSSAHMF